MEEVFGDVLGLFGAEIEDDDRYVYYGGVEIGSDSQGTKQLEPEVLFDRLIVDGNTCMCTGRVSKKRCSRDEQRW